MAQSKYHRPQHPSNVRARRAAHIAHDAEVKARKRSPTAGERARQRIRAAKLGVGQSGFWRGPSRVFVAAIDGATGEVVGPYVELTTTYAVGPFVCAQKKVKEGWAIVDEPRDAVVAYEGSRSKARARRDRLNAGEERVEL